MEDKYFFRNKFGYSKIFQICRYKHFDSNCGILMCDKRHSRECFWFKKLERCKFSHCSYKHTITEKYQMLK